MRFICFICTKLEDNYFLYIQLPKQQLQLLPLNIMSQNMVEGGDPSVLSINLMP